MYSGRFVDRVYLLAGLFGLAGVGLVFTIVFAAAGVVLLVAATALLLGGLLIQLLEPTAERLMHSPRGIGTAGRAHTPAPSPR